jgi:hypothetical protein
MLKRFVSEDELHRSSDELKLTPCPFCKRIGTLIHHGWLYGYLDTDSSQKTARSRRVFCNNRKTRNNGCGHTFTVRAAETLQRSCLKATGLWTFLKDVLELSNKAAALRKLDLAASSAYRLWQRFLDGQSRIRSLLNRICPPPDLPDSSCPAAQTVAHLEAAFGHERCPIVAFQERLQVSFT